jgi:hypothetical protein
VSRHSVQQAPVQTMHEDDPVFLFGKRISWLNRKRLRVLIFTGALLTFAWTVYSVYTVLEAQNAVNQERTDRKAFVDARFHDFACIIVRPYPNSVASVIRDLRTTYHCPSYHKPKGPLPAPATPTASPTQSGRSAGSLPEVSRPRRKGGHDIGATGQPFRTGQPSPVTVPKSTQPTQKPAPGNPTPSHPVSRPTGPIKPPPSPILCGPIKLCLPAPLPTVSVPVLP